MDPRGLRGVRGGKNGREKEEGIRLDESGVADGRVSKLGCPLPWRLHAGPSLQGLAGTN